MYFSSIQRFFSKNFSAKNVHFINQFVDHTNDNNIISLLGPSDVLCANEVGRRVGRQCRRQGLCILH